jgi:hypothetical protein
MARVGENLRPLSARQRQIVTAISSRRNVYAIGGKGSGKSTGTAYAAGMLSYYWAPNSNGLAFAPTWQQVKDLILERWQAVAPRGLYELCTSGTKETGPHIKVFHPREGKPPATSIIYLRTGEAPKRVEGLSVGWAWGEEIQDCEELWDLAGDRIRDANCPHLVRFGAGLPEQGWLEDVFEGIPDGVYDPETDSEWITCTTWDNQENLPPGFIEQRRRDLTPEEFRNRVEGKFVSSEDSVYPTFERRVHVQPCPSDPALKLYGGVDFNNRPMTCAWLHRPGGEWRIVGEVAKPGTTEEHAGRLVDWCEERSFTVLVSTAGAPAKRRPDPRRVVLVPDASGSSRQHATGKSDHEILRQAGFELDAPKANPPIKDRDNAVLRALKDAAGAAHLFVDPSCRAIIEAFSKLRQTGRERSPYSHLTDCVGYVLHRFAPVVTAPPMPAPVSVPRPSGAPAFRRPGKVYPL